MEKQLPDLTDAALVLVGHGSTLNAESSLPTYQHARAIRERGVFGQVQECFWKLEPSISSVLRTIHMPRVFVVPLFISEGYFTEEVIPRELGLCIQGQLDFARIQQKGSHLIHYCGPVGTHDSMNEVILARALDILVKHPFPRSPHPSDCSLFIAGHGTSNNENSRKSIEHQVELIRSQSIFADVHGVFMEEDPRIEDCYALANKKNIVMVPFFISDGLHSFEDIPVMLGEPEKVVQQRYKQGLPTWRNPSEKNGKRVWYTSSIGLEPLITKVIMDRILEIIGNPILIASK